MVVSKTECAIFGVWKGMDDLHVLPLVDGVLSGASDLNKCYCSINIMPHIT